MTKTNAACAKKNNGRNKLNRRASPPFFSPCEYSNEGSAALCQPGCGFWPFQCHRSQKAGGAPIAQRMPRAEHPKDICRSTVAAAPWHALRWFTCKANFSGDSPDQIPTSPGLQKVKCLDQRSWAAGFGKKLSQEMKNKRGNLLGFSGIHTGFSWVQDFLFLSSPLSNFLRAHSNEPSHHSSHELSSNDQALQCACSCHWFCC